MRTSRLKSACVVGMLLLCGVARSEQPWITALGKEMLVCVSPKADAQVQQAAARVLAEVQKVQPKAKLVDPDALATDYNALGTNHVICVGRWADNQVLRMTWGHWANLREEREWNAKGEERAREITGLWEKNIPAQDWRWQHDLFAFGYGDFDGADVGYVQTVRNPFPILLRTVPGQTQYDARVPRPFDQTGDHQMRFVIDLTGTGPAGVAKAVDAFLKDGLLNGVIPGAGAKLQEDWRYESLGSKQLATDLPAWAPVSKLPPGVAYLGQQMTGGHLYGGFCQASGVRPQRLWRLKYSDADGFRFFDSYPTNRASGNELLIAACASEAEAQKAAAAMRKNMPKDPQRVTWEFGGHSYAIYGDDFQEMLTWQEAKEFCQKQGGHLVTLGSKAEQDAMNKALQRSQTNAVFLGLSGDWQANRWAWVTGEPLTFRGFIVKNGKEVYSRTYKKGGDIPEQKVPTGSNLPVWFRNLSEQSTGWCVDDRNIGAFVCEWDKPGAAPRPAAAPVRIGVRGQYVLVQSFKDAVGEAILRQAEKQ